MSATNMTAEAIRALAARHGVIYVPTEGDALGEPADATAGGKIRLDPVERLLVALHRAGHLSGADMSRLQAEYLDEAA